MMARMVLTLLVAVVLWGLIGCRKQTEPTSTPEQQSTAPAPSTMGAQESAAGTAEQPAASPAQPAEAGKTAEPNQTSTTASQKEPG
jgi:cytoskeletal protein RodZ